MKSKLLALTAAALGLAGSVYADAPNGDLILGFVPDGSVASGSSTNLMVDLGNAGGFINAGPGTYTVANLGSDLASTYGASWASTTLSYGVVGTNGTSGTAVPGAPARTDFFTYTTALPTPAAGVNSGSTISSLSVIGGMYTSQNMFGTGSTATPLSDLSSQNDQVNGAALNGITTGAAGGFSNSMGNSSSFKISSGLGNAQFLTTVSSGNVADLLSIGNNNGASKETSPPEGYFSLNSNGVLTFTVIPEPSTYAAILGAVTVGFVMLRRRRTAGFGLV